MAWLLSTATPLGCTPPPLEVAGTGPTTDPPGSTGASTDASGVSLGSSATVASADGTSGSDEGEPTTTLPPDGTTSGEPTTTTATSEPGGSSSGGMEGSTTTGEPGECHPVLAEVLYTLMGGDNSHEWIKLYNPCDAAVDMAGYSLGWGGGSYGETGVVNLNGMVGAGACFVVGGGAADNDNGNPVFDQVADFHMDLENGVAPGDGIALFLGDAASITGETIPIDAVIYGDNNDNGLIDASGTAPADSHVEGAPDGQSIRRTSLAATWEVAPSLTPNACPPL
jgi:hypothetical protein